MVNYQLFFSTFVPKISKTIEMKRLFYPIMILLCAILYVSCDNYETYGDKKAKERDAINKFISENNIKVINEDQFEDQDYTTDTAKNEYVRMSRTGVYMQIVRKGCGTQLEQKKSVNVICRFTEYNILADSVMLSNLAPFYIYDYNSGSYFDVSQYYDKMNVSRNGTTFTASFVSGLMMRYHSSSTSVPSGWLVPLNFINIGRPANENEETAFVRLIVPHSQGTADASASVYPCHYEISYEREK